HTEHALLLVGLTGSIASGKSTVSLYFRQLGAVIIDADVLAREVVEPGTPGLEQVIATFGKQLLTATGALDRKKLGEIGFGNDAQRKELERIVHPLVFQRFSALSEQAKTKGERAVIYDAALLFERGLNHLMNATVVVTVPPAVQLQRLIARDVLTDAE